VSGLRLRSALRAWGVGAMVMALGVLAFAGTATAASPGWKLLGITAPTHVPPVSSEVQTVSVDATGGTFTLTFEGQTTAPMPFDVAAGDLQTALADLSSIGGAGGSVEVDGGPGDAGATKPYGVRFRGSLASTDVTALVADSSGLTGGAASASVTTTTVGGEPGEGSLAIYPSNVGGAPTAGTITLNIGPLPAGIETAGSAIGRDWTCTPDGAGQTSLTCLRSTPVIETSMADPVILPIRVVGSPAPTSVVQTSIEGGGAAGSSTYAIDVTVSDSRAEAGVQAAWAGAFDDEGKPATEAGAHPYTAATLFFLKTNLTAFGDPIPAGDVRDLFVDLPPGFIGNPLVTERCPQTLLICEDPAMQIGEAAPLLSESPVGASGINWDQTFKVENDMPAKGYAAQFTFKVVDSRISALGTLRSDEDYGVTVVAPSILPHYEVYGSYFELDGRPAAAGGKAFLTNPTDCANEAVTAPITTFTSNSWQAPTIFDEWIVDIPPVVGCEGLEFKPAFSFQPSAQSAATGVAATAHLQVDQEGLLDPAKRATPHLKDSVVTLPVGFTLNPSAADGLESCSTEQIGYVGGGFPMPNPMRFDKEPVACPDASKIGTAEIKTPLLEDPLKGTVYLAAQDDNPFKSLLAMYIAIDDEQTGTVVKLPGEVVPNPVNGQLVATFANNPQLPFEDLILSFRGGGPRSTLATPDVCSTYTTNGEFTPWSAPESGPPAQTQDSFEITTGVGGSATCPRTKAERPFSLGFEAGATHPVSGAASPFTLRITRPDGNQELDRITVSTPPGLIASLVGVGTCSEAQLAAAQAPGRTGKQEIADPSCPASSQLGTTTIGAGVGSNPIYVKTGKVYLSGPYKGAPLSFAFVVPAVAGPFDLGVQVVRTALRINPQTAQVTAESDSIPQILKGIPLLVRDVRVDIDRPGFIRNPTNCEPMAVSGQVTGGSGAVANVASRYQVGDCDKLGFQPSLKLRLQGGTKRDKYQKLTATLTARPGDANIAFTSVRFPRSIFLAQEHIRTVCTRVQFALDSCPPGSVYGYAEAVTPLLDQPVQGPVYLRSSNNVLPDLVAALRGPDHQPIKVELSARTDSKNKGIRNTFDIVPDAPVSTFVLRMKGGNKSLLVTSRDICKRKERATVKMRGQNGMVRNFKPVLQADCGKKKPSKGKKRGGKGRR